MFTRNTQKLQNSENRDNLEVILIIEVRKNEIRNKVRNNKITEKGSDRKDVIKVELIKFSL